MRDLERLGVLYEEVGRAWVSLQWCPKALRILKSRHWRDASGYLECGKTRRWHLLVTGTIPAAAGES